MTRRAYLAIDVASISIGNNLAVREPGIETKVRVYGTLVLSALLYNSVTSTLKRIRKDCAFGYVRVVKSLRNRLTGHMDE